MHDAADPFSLAAAARFQETFPAFQGGGRRRRGSTSPSPPTAAGRPVGVRVTDDLRGHVVANPGDVPVERDPGAGRAHPVAGRRRHRLRRGRRPRPGRAELQQRFPGLRPVLFASPYEAAAWALIGHRIRMTQAGTLRARMSAELGEPVDFGDRVLHAFPAPERLARPRADARADRSARWKTCAPSARPPPRASWTPACCARCPPEAALTHLKKLPGIGPFSAELIMIRGAGVVDAFPERDAAAAPGHGRGLRPRAGAAARDAPGHLRTSLAALSRAGCAFLLRNAA